MFKFINKRKIAENLYKYRVFYFIISAVAVLAFCFGLPELYMESSNESYFIQGDPILSVYDSFKEEFGSDEFVYLLFEMENAFTPEKIQLINELKQELEEIPKRS